MTLKYASRERLFDQVVKSGGGNVRRVGVEFFGHEDFLHYSLSYGIVHGLGSGANTQNRKEKR